MAAKSQARPRTKKKTSSNTAHSGHGSFFWLGSGFLLGVLVTSLIFFRYPTSIKEGVVGQQLAKVQKSTSSKVQKPTFDFYTILPEMEVVVDTQEDTEHKNSNQVVIPNPVASAQSKATKGLYILQLASFKKHAEADQYKARLALLGFEANIEKVLLETGEEWHRVRLGPFHSQQQALQTKSLLGGQNINSLLLKLKS